MVLGDPARLEAGKTGNNVIDILTSAGDEASCCRDGPTAQSPQSATVAAAALAGPHPGVLGGVRRRSAVDHGPDPAGSFQMGPAEQAPGRKANEGPVHEVTLSEFLIGQTPITQAQWRAVAGWQAPPDGAVVLPLAMTNTG
jgi:hypothetical protein